MFMTENSKQKIKILALSTKPNKFKLLLYLAV